MRIKNNRMKSNQLVFSGLMIALTFLAGNIIKIPSLGGYIQLGDCMVFLSVVLLGKKRGAFVGAIGMALVDIYGGFFLWAPFTFVIKGIMAYVTGTLLEKFKNKTLKAYIVSFGLSGIITVILYFIAGIIMILILTSKSSSFMSAVIYSSKDVLGNVIQVVVGIVIAIPLSKILSNVHKNIIQLR